MGSEHDYRERELRSPSAIAPQIIFRREYPGKEELTFLLLEGETDRRLFENFVDA